MAPHTRSQAAAIDTASKAAAKAPLTPERKREIAAQELRRARRMRMPRIMRARFRHSGSIQSVRELIHRPADRRAAIPSKARRFVVGDKKPFEELVYRPADRRAATPSKARRFAAGDKKSPLRRVRFYHGGKLVREWYTEKK